MAVPDEKRKFKILLSFSLSFAILGVLCFSLYTILEPFIAEILSILHRNTIYAQYIVLGVGAGLVLIGIIIGIFAYREWRRNKKTIYNTFA